MALDAAAADLRKAIEAVEILQGNDQVVSNPYLSVTSRFAAVYEELVSLLSRKFLKDRSKVVFSQALQVAEQRSARRFLEMLSLTHSQLLNSLPAPDRMFLRQIESHYRAQLAQVRSPQLDAGARLKLLTELQNTFKGRQQHVNELREKYPREMEMLYPTASSVARMVEDLLDRRAIESTVPGGTERLPVDQAPEIGPQDLARARVELPLKAIALVRYFVGKDEVFIFYLSSQRIEIIKSPAKPDRLRNKIHVFRRALRSEPESR